MDAPPPAGTGARLALGSPLHLTSLDRLLAVATAPGPARIVDHGCGWGETLLRAVQMAPGSTGLGVDTHAPDIERAERAAADRGLSDRTEFRIASAVDHREPGDLLLSLGAYQAFGTIADAARVLREDLRPGGRAVLGVEYWAHPPTHDELAHMWPGASAEDCLTLPEVVGTLHASGWRVLAMYDSTRAEWDDFEVGHLLEREEWLLQHPGHPLREELDARWSSWLRGHRRSLGFVTFVLG